MHLRNVIIKKDIKKADAVDCIKTRLETQLAVTETFLQNNDQMHLRNAIIKRNLT